MKKGNVDVFKTLKLIKKLQLKVEKKGVASYEPIMTNDIRIKTAPNENQIEVELYAKNLCGKKCHMHSAFIDKEFLKKVVKNMDEEA